MQYCFNIILYLLVWSYIITIWWDIWILCSRANTQFSRTIMIRCKSFWWQYSWLVKFFAKFTAFCEQTAFKDDSRTFKICSEDTLSLIPGYYYLKFCLAWVTHLFSSIFCRFLAFSSSVRMYSFLIPISKHFRNRHRLQNLLLETSILHFSSYGHLKYSYKGNDASHMEHEKLSSVIVRLTWLDIGKLVMPLIFQLKTICGAKHKWTQRGNFCCKNRTICPTKQ